MGNVVSIKAAPQATPDEPFSEQRRDYVGYAFERLGRVGLTPRPSQDKLARAVRDALKEARPLVAEAPTGTGKTLAYLVGALAAAQDLSVDRQMPIVIATATKGLQSQILDNDIGHLVRAELLDSGEAVLAKGRQNYFCVHAAEQLIEAGDHSQAEMFAEDDDAGAEDPRPHISLDVVGKMLEHHYAQAWDGDIDHWPLGDRPEGWERVAANSETCIGRACPHFDTCPLFRARARMAFARIVVANQDLVLADLAMRKEDVDPVLPFEQYLAVFDEAHHLPDKALGAARVDVQLQVLEGAFGPARGFADQFFRIPELVKAADRKTLAEADLSVAELLASLASLKATVQGIPVDSSTFHLRLRAGELPPSLLAACSRTQSAAGQLRDAFSEAVSILKGLDVNGRHAALAGKVNEMLGQYAAVKAHLATLDSGLDTFLSDKPGVRWVYVNEPVSSLHYSPVEGAEVLREVLWEQTRVRPVLISATLRDIRGFERFARKAGLPEDVEALAVESEFPYRENTVVLANMRHGPRRGEVERYRKELLETLPQFINPREGSLILCSSWSLLRLLAPVLVERFGSRVRMQGKLSFQALIRAHRRAVDLGEGSILVGVATLAEGLDLPGDYCKHVLITGIPFAVPSNPVEQEVAEQLGPAYFAERAMPDAFVKLVQMVGRLMRRSQDRGRITMFDNRLYLTPYGRQMLHALPPYRIRIERHDGSDRPGRVREA